MKKTVNDGGEGVEKSWVKKETTDFYALQEEKKEGGREG
jgi:hypothetical protein